MIRLSLLFKLDFFKNLKIGEIFKEISFFSDLKQGHWNFLDKYLYLKSYNKGEYIFRQGDYDSTLYLLLTGKVILKEEDGKREVLNILNEKSLFGISSAISGTPHSATAEAIEDSLILEIPFPAMIALRRFSQKFTEEMDKIYLERAFFYQIKHIPLFKDLNEKDIKFIRENMVLKNYKKGNLIVKEGLIADTFYIIRHGYVEVFTEREGKKKIIAYLKGGNFFGEMALLEGRIRKASVMAKTEVGCVEIPRHGFLKLYEESISFKNLIDKTIKERKREELEPFSIEEIGKKYFAIDIKKCIFCNACIDACKFFRGNPRISFETKKVGKFLFPLPCDFCEDPICMLCPIGAIKKGRKGEVIITEHCNGCGWCIKVCPFKAIKFYDNLAYKCDLCYSFKRQACLYHCPTKAIEFISKEAI